MMTKTSKEMVEDINSIIEAVGGTTSLIMTEEMAEFFGYEPEERECPQCGNKMERCHDKYDDGWTCRQIDCDGYTEWDSEE